MRRLIALGWMLGAVLLAPAAWAANVAVLFANGVYQNYPFFQNAGAILNLERPLRQAGFEVLVIRNPDSQTFEEDMPAISRRLAQAEKVIVVASGYVARTARDSWLVAADARNPNPFSIGRYGLSLGALLDLAADKPGDVLVAIAEDQNNIDLGKGLLSGYAPRNIPQGVTVVSGTPEQVSDFIVNGALVPGRSLAEMAEAMPRGFRADGFLPRSIAFLPVSQTPSQGNLIERSYWQRTQSLNTAAAYQAYLDRYPNGLFATEARRQIDALSITPQDRARMTEEALNLSVSQRRGVQNNLTLLGFDTRGVDGVFGGRTRSAIADWQRSIGIPVTGYLSANQVSQLHTAGALRAEQLRIEAERRRLEEQRQDRDYWARTGAGGSEAGLRAYLDRFPDGLHSEAANQQLDYIEREKRRQADANELNVWNQTRMAGTLEAYESYLRDYPNGRFVEEARARVASLSHPETPSHVVEAARREEASLNLNGFRRQLIENQLNALGLNPGPVDGKFDNLTRRALRQYQRANDLEPTGYVTRATIVRLLVSSIDR